MHVSHCAFTGTTLEALNQRGQWKAGPKGRRVAHLIAEGEECFWGDLLIYMVATAPTPSRAYPMISSR